MEDKLFNKVKKTLWQTEKIAPNEPQCFKKSSAAEAS